MPATPLLSQRPDAKRKRDWRAKRRAATSPGMIATSSSSAAGATPVAPPGPPPSTGLHETVRVTGPGPEAFASLPFLPSSKEGELGAALIADEPAAAAQPVISEAEAAQVAALFVTVMSAGWDELLSKRRGFKKKLSRVFDVEKHMPSAKRMVFQSAMRLAIKYNVSFAYGDESIVIGGGGIAVLGFVCKPDDDAKNDNAARQAKDANETTGDAVPDMDAGDMSEDELAKVGRS